MANSNVESSSVNKVNTHPPNNARWQQQGVTVAGGHGEGSHETQLKSPFGLFVDDDDDQTIIIADTHNHRIVQWKRGDAQGLVVAGGNGEGGELDQLNRPTDVLVDKETNSLIIADRRNRRILRWSRRSGTTEGEVLIENIGCYGLAMDEERNLYVSDYERHEVRRYKIDRGDKTGTVIAGGSGKGSSLNQLNWPRYLFVHRNQSVYVSDYDNHRVMKWDKGAREGVVVAGGQGYGGALTQLAYPNGIFVDSSGTLYVAEGENNRVTRWLQGSEKKGIVAVGGRGWGSRATQLIRPVGLFLDKQDNLYVVDADNHRVQRFVGGVIFDLPVNERWQQQGVTVAGRHDVGWHGAQLNNPLGLFVDDDDDQTIIIADTHNHRIMQWKRGDAWGQIVAGGNDRGNRLNQLTLPTYALIDKERNSLIIADWGNRRILRWSRRNGTTEGEVLIKNTGCYGLAMDEKRNLYVSDEIKHEIRRYNVDRGDKTGTVIVDENGIESDFTRRFWPTHFFVDKNQSVYVSDRDNHRIIKWDKGAREGVVVAGGQQYRSALTQLSYPNGIFVDTFFNIYVAEGGTNRITYWSQGSEEKGAVVVGGNGQGSEANQLHAPVGLAFDKHRNLYVVDEHNNRVQRFDFIE